MSINTATCIHGVNLDAAKCYLCADPAFHAAQQPGLPVFMQLMTGLPDPRDQRIAELERELESLWLMPGMKNLKAAETEHDALKAENEALARDAAGKQARIDALMLEYCPDEMTDEQKAEWARHQQRGTPADRAMIDAALTEVKSR